MIDSRVFYFKGIRDIPKIIPVFKRVIGDSFQSEFRAASHLNRQIPTRKNMKDPRGQSANFLFFLQEGL